MKLSERMHNREPMGIHGHQVEEWAIEVAQLEAERDKWMQGHHDLSMQVGEYQDRVDELEAENQRLREWQSNVYGVCSDIDLDIDSLKEE